FALAGVLSTALVVGLALRAATSEPERRRVWWLLTGVVVGTLPMVGGVPDGRVLLIPMLVSVPLVATAIEYAFGVATGPRKLVRVGGAALCFMHLGVAPLARVATTAVMVGVGQEQRALAESAD